MKLLLFFYLIVFGGIFICAKETPSPSVTKLQLNKNWQFSESGKNLWHTASVPGCVHTDLLANKLIPDPFYRTNEQSLQWIGEKDWEYKAEFELTQDILGKKNIELFFKGLDTYADVYLNNSLILTADNMFCEWRKDVKRLLQKHNTLRIVFRNVFSVNLPKWKSAPYKLQAFPNNDQADTMLAVYSRKAQFHYGWDWGPRLITCGIWRDIVLEAWDEVKINNVYIKSQNVSSQSAGINSALSVESGSEAEATVELRINGEKISETSAALKKGTNSIPVNYTIKNPRLWWTNGLGEPYLYDFSFKLIINNKPLDSIVCKTGIRSVELVRNTDSLGKSFYFKINGVPVFMKGANYIPQDNFQNRVTAKDYEYIVKSAAEANMNMLRLWGGGIFQDDAFYDMCDKYGILIWHDLMFACGMYPDNTCFIESVKQELADNVSRIRNHPSLAFYCGNNENFVAWYSWGWKQLYDTAAQARIENFMNTFYKETIPLVLKQYDPQRAYSFSSPSAGFNNIPYNEGDIHYWGVWHGQEPFDCYNKNIARFVSEYGFQSYPEINTINKFALPEDKDIHSPVMLAHQRCMADERKDKEYGNRLIRKYMDMYYNTPTDFENYVYVSQVLQAEGGRVAVEAHRSNMPFCMGSLFWQIDDCWPVASWSSIDYYGNWKALHYYARRFYLPALICPRVKNDSLIISIASDYPENKNLQFEVTCQTLNGTLVSAFTKDIELKAGTAAVYSAIPISMLIKNELKGNVVVSFSLKENALEISSKLFYLVQPKDLMLASTGNILYSIKHVQGGARIELKTGTLAKDVFISLKGAQATYSDNYFDLLPGEIKTIDIKTDTPFDEIKSGLKIISLRDTYK